MTAQELQNPVASTRRPIASTWMRLAGIGRTLGLIAAAVAPPIAAAEPVLYNIDPDHTHPAFEADHLGGLSTWRGLFGRTTGSITLDRKARTGAVDIVVDVASIDFGHDELNKVAAFSAAPPIFEVTKYPIARYVGRLQEFANGSPTSVEGTLSLHGRDMPLTLAITSFRCLRHHPTLKAEVCGADAVGSLNRAAFGITVGERYGFSMDVTLRVQVEAIRATR